MSTYSALIATAQRLIANKGQVVTWRKISSVPSDPAKPWLGDSPSNQDFLVSIVFFTTNNKTLNNNDTLEFVKSSLKGFMGQVEFAPSLKDIIIRNGKELSISSIDIISPNGEKILYDITFNA